MNEIRLSRVILRFQTLNFADMHYAAGIQTVPPQLVYFTYFIQEKRKNCYHDINGSE